MPDALQKPTPNRHQALPAADGLRSDTRNNLCRFGAVFKRFNDFEDWVIGIAIETNLVAVMAVHLASIVSSRVGYVLLRKLPVRFRIDGEAHLAVILPSGRVRVDAHDQFLVVSRK